MKFKTLLSLLLLSAPTVLARTPAPSVLKDGTPVLLSTREKMVSGETPEGTPVEYRVERDVLGPKGEVLIPEGAKAFGTVTKSEGSGFFGRSGALNLSLETALAADGTSVPIRALRAATADDSETGVIVGAVLLSVFFVFMEGDDVEIPAGTVFSAFVSHDVPIAKPLPPKIPLAQLQQPKSFQIVSPKEGEVVQKEDQIVVTCDAKPPADDQAFVRLYVDNKLVNTQKGSPTRIEWDTRKYEKLAEEGEHTLQADLTYRTGQVVTSGVQKFTLKD